MDHPVFLLTKCKKCWTKFLCLDNWKQDYITKTKIPFPSSPKWKIETTFGYSEKFHGIVNLSDKGSFVVHSKSPRPSFALTYQRICLNVYFESYGDDE